HWVPRTGQDALANALEARDWSNWHAWMTPESASLKHLRSRMRDEFGFPKSEMHTQAYWVEGRAMGKQRELEHAAAGAAVAGVSGEPKPPGSEAPARESEQDRERAPASASGTKGAWRAAAGGRLLASLKPVF